MIELIINPVKRASNCAVISMVHQRGQERPQKQEQTNSITGAITAAIRVANTKTRDIAAFSSVFDTGRDKNIIKEPMLIPVNSIKNGRVIKAQTICLLLKGFSFPLIFFVL